MQARRGVRAGRAGSQRLPRAAELSDLEEAPRPGQDWGRIIQASEAAQEGGTKPSGQQSSQVSQGGDLGNACAGLSLVSF